MNTIWKWARASMAAVCLCLFASPGLCVPPTPPPGVTISNGRAKISQGITFDTWSTFTDEDATPSIQGDANWKTANTGATTISDFDDGIVGEVIWVYVTDAFTTFDFTESSLYGNNGSDYSASANDLLMFKMVSSSEWACLFLGRGDASVVGSDTQVIFNDGGSVYNGDSGLTYNKTTDVLTTTGGFDVSQNATGPQMTYFFEDSDNGGGIVGIGAAASITNDLTLLLPSTADPTADQILTFAVPSSVTFSDNVARDASASSWRDLEVTKVSADGPQLVYLREDSDNGSNYVGWGAAADVTNDLILGVPSTADPTVGQIMEFAAPASVTGSDNTARDTSTASWGYRNKVNITSKSSAYTVGTDDPCECYGGMIYVTSAATITACDNLADGMSFTVATVGATAVSVDVQSDDLMYLDGTALDDGDKATNTSTTGDTIHFVYYDSTGWWAMSGSPDGDHWSDGGP